MGGTVSDEIVAFRIDVPERDLADLRERLGRTRWPDAETVDDWSQGIPLAYVQELCEYWASQYDWRATEARLNDLGSHRTEIDGLGFHFLHVPSPEPDALPLVLTHGWPGSIIEFHKVIGPLTHPVAHGGDASDAFHVVCPSLPGYGFSDQPSGTGWKVPRIAAAWMELMARLGYDRYGAQGGDWGSSVTTSIGRQGPAHVVGIHLNMVIALPDLSMGEPTERERAALASFKHYSEQESGYSTQQSTRPQTLGYGLADSPAAQAAWIVEKFMAWTDCDGDPENILTRNELLDNVMLYWLPDAGASSARLYWESFTDVDTKLEAVTDPVGVSVIPKEISRPSRRWAEPRFPDIRHWNELDRGGHFAAFEQPDAFVDEVRTFFRQVRGDSA